MSDQQAALAPATRPYHHGDLRAELLRHAEALLRTAGADGLSLRQLAREARVSHAAPSRHFRDKQALLDALAISGFGRIGADFASCQLVGDFREQLLAVAHLYLDFAIDNPELLAVMFSRRRQCPQLVPAATQAFAVPNALIACAQTNGLIVPGDPTQLGMTVASAVQGLATFVGSGLVPQNQAGRLLTRIVDDLLLGLSPRTPLSTRSPLEY